MALAKECDACGDFFKFSSDDTKPNGITLGWFNQNGVMAKSIVKKELCPNCLDKIDKILNGEEN